MESPDSLALAADAKSEGLEAILVGGNAVNLHAYFRTTFDVDLLIPEAQVERWITFFAKRGYTILHRTPNFVRVRFAADPAAALPVDLMLADDATFRRVSEQTSTHEIGDGRALLVPSVLDLIAMKLHALRNDQRARIGIDLQDVKHLLRTAKIDPNGQEFGAIAERYATEKIRAKIFRDFAEESGS